MEKISDIMNDGLFPQWAYNNDEIFDMEMEHIFGRQWIYVGHGSEIPEPGDYARRYIGEDPFIFVRDEDEEINVLYNSCRHRGARICTNDSGNTSHFRCPYHAWVYNNSGKLIGMPKKEELYGGLEDDEWGLIKAPRVDEYRGLVFASLDEEGPGLDEYLGDAKWFLDFNFGLTEGGMEVIGEPWRWQADYNWKVGVENSAADNYHAIPTHQSAFEVGAGGVSRGSHMPIYECDGPIAGSFRISDKEEEEFWSYSPEIMAHLNTDLHEDQIEAARLSNFFGCAIFPTFTFFHLPSVRSAKSDPVPYLSLRTHRPLGPNRTEIWRWVFAPAEASDEEKRDMYNANLSGFSPTGMLEPDDIAAWERVTAPAGSSFAKKHNVRLNLEQGKADISGGLDVVDWLGPAKYAKDQMHEYGVRSFQRMWLGTIQDGQTHEGQLTVEADDDDN